MENVLKTHVENCWTISKEIIEEKAVFSVWMTYKRSFAHKSSSQRRETHTKKPVKHEENGGKIGIAQGSNIYKKNRDSERKNGERKLELKRNKIAISAIKWLRVSVNHFAAP